VADTGTSQHDFDWARCTEMHNKLVDIGWSAISDPDWVQYRDMRSWWKVNFEPDSDDESDSEEDGNDDKVNVENINETGNENNELEIKRALAEELEGRLVPDLARFLKVARHDCPGWIDDSHLFYYAKRLRSPVNFISDLNAEFSDLMLIEKLDKNRYIVLYDHAEE
jgi:hypothetical protein